MRQRRLADLSVGAIGLGGMPMSIEGRPDRSRSIATVHAALDAGVTLVDTADAYHVGADEVGHNEELVAEALRSWGGDASSVVVATKGGHLRPGDGSWTIDGHPAYLVRAAKESARRLGVDCIGLYQFHRPDPRVPYAESVGALGTLLDEGVIARAGISNASVAQIDEANEVLGGRLASVQNQFSPQVPLEPRRARPLRAARHRLPAVEPARWHLDSGRARDASRRLRGGGEGARREPSAGGARLGALARRRRHPHPGSVAAGIHRGLGARGGPRARPGGARQARPRRVVRP